MKLYPDAALKYVNESGRVRTPKSRASFLQALRYLQRRNPRLQLEDFRYSHLHAFCITPKANGEPVASSTMLSRRNSVRSFFSWAHFVDLIPEDPAAKLVHGLRISSKIRVRRHTWLTEDQFADLILNTGDDIAGRRERLILMTAGLTGLRCFEIVGLRWSKFSPDFRLLSFVGKSLKLAEVGVSEQLVTELVEWREICEDPDVIFPALRSVTNFGGRDEPKRLIVDWSRPLGESGLRTVVANAGRRAGIPNLRTHDLRRSYAGMLEAQGMPVRDIMMALRHSNLSTTDTYLEKNPARAIAVTQGFSIDLTRRKLKVVS